MTTALHTLYAVDVDSTLIDQITNQAVSPNVANLVRRTDGQVYPTYAAAGAISPTISFTTEALATALGKVGTTGFFVDGDGGNTVICFFQKLDNGGTRAGATSHLKIAVNEGIVIPRRLHADASGATLDYDLIATWDGTNDPLVFTASQSLAGSPSGDEGFVLGPVKINGTQLDGVQSMDLDFGIQEIVRGSDGEEYPRYVAIGAIAPMISITCDDAEAINTFGIDGTAQGGTQSEIYIRALAEGGARAANNASSHIKILNTASKGRIHVDSVGGSDIMAATVTITPTSAGTSHPLTITTGTTIPAGL